MKAPSTAVDRRLREAGLRRTPVRVAILNILESASDPLDAPTITGRIAGPVDTVTVYRTLNTFTRKKLVHRVFSENGWRYAAGRPDAKAAHQHPHFVCEACGGVECVNDAAVPRDLVRSLRLTGDYRVNYAEVVVHGTCPKCA